MKKLTIQEQALLQLTKDQNEWNSLICKIQDLRNGFYPEDYEEFLHFKFAPNKLSLAKAKQIQFFGTSGTFLNQTYYISEGGSRDFVLVEVTLDNLNEISKIGEIRPVQENERVMPKIVLTKIPFQDESKMDYADKIIFEHYLQNDISQMPENLRKFIPTDEESSEGFIKIK
jgi:hypothetical protein